MKIGVLLYTYNRIDDARINMEIIRNLWKQNGLLKDVVIVHSFNGLKEWWPEKYLEDELLYLENPGHFTGAELLMNEGMRCFSEKYPDVDYVITLASDTWCLKPVYLADIIKNMQGEEKYLATCAWGTKERNNMWDIGMALDLNILDLKWMMQYKVFPLRFVEFVEKYSEIFHYRDEIIYLERVFALRFKQAILNFVMLPSENLIRRVAEAYVYRMVEREPMERARYSSKTGIIGCHEPEPKRKILKKMKLNLGIFTKKILNSKKLD